MNTPASVSGGAAPVRVALVGLGWAARSIWLPRLREHPAYRVTALVDPSAVAREAVGSELAGAQLVADVADLGTDLVDLAVVAVPNHLHAGIACRLLAKGVPVFVEKPVCLTTAEARELDAAERAGGAVLLSGSAARYRSDVRQLYGLVAELGRIRHVELAWVRARGVPDVGGWFTRRQLSGGGALVDLGWHLLDTLAPLLAPSGFTQVVGTVSDDFVNSAAARAAWRDGEPPADGTGDVEDTARGFLVTDDGVSVALRASWASHQPSDVTSIRVEGRDGTATLRCTFGFSPNREAGSTLTCTRDGDTKVLPVPDEPIGTEYARQLDELPALLADPASRGRAVAETHRTIKVIERIYASARLARAGRHGVGQPV